MRPVSGSGSHQVSGRVVGIVAVGVDREDSQVGIATADVWPDQPERRAREPWKPGQGPRPEEGPALSPPAREEVVDGPTLAHLDVVGHVMGRKSEDEPLDELRMPDGQPLSVVAARRDSHHADGPPPLRADDRRVVIGHVGGAAARRQVGAPAHLGKREVMAGEGLEPALPGAASAATVAGSAVNDSPGMYSTIRDPVPIRANGCPAGRTPVSMSTMHAIVRRRYAPPHGRTSPRSAGNGR